ncbi:DUF3667 domain-containing protein [Chryseobacterium carnipullorum]|uniref:DUF3667 domain-containing protein n=1 Tax=Chryseobacterium carnipullorum TaxID=1124835 RepID=UPI0009118C7F|nr:DUF3667 domain-containing protein [Chryseobacterium carnipullorum]SHM60971.1 Protein of unknown function [Chryseobacterium carnipullorum]HBV14902.1 DUF3667 domain-containing protein [Chryseobacterium carnipullorum]
MNEEFCSNCKQNIKPKRIDGHYILHEIEHVLHFDRGILYTIRELLIRPGENIRNFISENRSRLVKPVLFIIVTSLIYTIISHFFHIEEGYIKIDAAKGMQLNTINHWVQSHYGYSNIIMGGFIAFWLKIFFKKYDYNFFEILILLCFILGMEMLMFSVFAIFEGVTKYPLMQIAAVIVFVYFSWAVGQFFDKSRIASYFKALVSYILGMITFGISIAILGAIMDLIIQH